MTTITIGKTMRENTFNDLQTKVTVQPARVQEGM